jgi:hypothetical protein
MIYCLNLFFIGSSLLLLYIYVAKRKRNLSNLVTNKIVLKYSLLRSALGAIIFLAGALFAIPGSSFFNSLSRLILFLIFVVIGITNRKQKQALKKLTTH